MLLGDRREIWKVLPVHRDCASFAPSGPILRPCDFVVLMRCPCNRRLLKKDERLLKKEERLW